MSFWVRHLCDLCGFNHDSPDNQQDLSSQQQTFRANQSISRGSYQNGTTSLIDNEEEPPSDAPPPLPRPERTMTERSILIRTPGPNGPGNPHDPTGSTSTESNQPSISGTPGSLRRMEVKTNNGYSYAAESNADQIPSAQSEVHDDSEYLFLTDFKTAQTSSRNPTESNNFPHSSFRERRSSSDSVFTHEGPPSEGGSDVIVDQPLHPITPRYGGSRKQRLDSMPDCPPPPPPVKTHNERPRINMIDERGCPFPSDEVDDDDDDVIVEARTRSVATSGGLSPIDDSDLKRVPLNMQREFGVDEMGRRIPAGYNLSSGYDTEYINTADASSEARFGNLPSHRSEGTPQFPIVGAPFSSPGNRSAMSQATTSSSVFFSPGPVEWGYNRPQLYDTPSPVVPMYASPRTASPHHVSHKGSLYSSTNALAPRASPMRISSPQPSPAHGVRIRRSSSVGQLETAANELAAQTGPIQDSPGRVRRSSIDHRRPIYNIPPHPAMVHPALYGTPVPMEHLVSDFSKPNVPPPRPPKLDPSNKEPLPDPESSEYFNLSGCYTDGVPKSEVPLSPPHTEVVAFIRQDEVDPPASPPYSTIVKTIPLDESGNMKKKDKEVEGKTSRTSSSSGGSSSGTSSGRSSATAVYDVTTPSLREAAVVAPMYDIPKKVTETSLGGNDIYDTPKPAPGSLYDTPKPSPATAASLYDTPKPALATAASLYDTPTNKAALPDINEARPDYERMLDQLSPISNDVQSYTCMVGATSIVNTPPFVKRAPLSPNTGRSPAVSEPPPIKRDLKPKHGRASLGSDGGGSDTSKPHLSRSSYDDPHFDQGGRPSEPPISPPHAVLVHTIPAASVLPSPLVDSFSSIRPQDRLLPPERPPKTQSNLSPRTPPSANVLERTPSYNFERSRFTPDGPHSHTKQKPAPYVPGRPPKPMSMIAGASPSPTHRDDGSFRREYGRSQKFSGGSSVFTPSYGGSFHLPMSTVVPAPAMEQSERKLTYVELGQFEHRNAPESSQSSERLSKGDNVVEYSVLDPEKTEALQKMKVEREKEQLKRESRSVKGGKT